MEDYTNLDNNVQSVENLTNIIEQQPSLIQTPFINNIASLLAFFGGRHVVSDIYDRRSDLLCHPIIKIIFLFSIILMNIRNFKISILLFFIYIFFIDNYIENSCKETY